MSSSDLMMKAANNLLKAMTTKDGKKLTFAELEAKIKASGADDPAAVAAKVYRASGADPAEEKKKKAAKRAKKSMSDSDLMKSLMGCGQAGRNALEWTYQFGGTSLRLEALNCLKDMMDCKQRWDNARKGRKTWSETENLPLEDRRKVREANNKEDERFSKEQSAITAKMTGLEAKLVDHQIEREKVERKMGKAMDGGDLHKGDNRDFGLAYKIIKCEQNAKRYPGQASLFLAQRDEAEIELNALMDKKSLPAPTLRKGSGEGSRGGNITGHTASGKPIYARGQLQLFGGPSSKHLSVERERKAKEHDSLARQHGALSGEKHKAAAKQHKKAAEAQRNNSKRATVHSRMAHNMSQLSMDTEPAATPNWKSIPAPTLRKSDISPGPLSALECDCGVLPHSLRAVPLADPFLRKGAELGLGNVDMVGIPGIVMQPDVVDGLLNIHPPGNGGFEYEDPQRLWQEDYASPEDALRQAGVNIPYDTKQ